jgi:hypothetical protein
MQSIKAEGYDLMRAGVAKTLEPNAVLVEILQGLQAMLNASKDLISVVNHLRFS